MKKIYTQPDIKVVRIHPNNLLQLQSVSPPVLTGTNIDGIDGLDGYDEDGGDASEAW